MAPTIDTNTQTNKNTYNGKKTKRSYLFSFCFFFLVLLSSYILFSLARDFVNKKNKRFVCFFSVSRHYWHGATGLFFFLFLNKRSPRVKALYLFMYNEQLTAQTSIHKKNKIYSFFNQLPRNAVEILVSFTFNR